MIYGGWLKKTCGDSATGFSKKCSTHFDKIGLWGELYTYFAHIRKGKVKVIRVLLETKRFPGIICSVFYLELGLQSLTILNSEGESFY